MKVIHIKRLFHGYASIRDYVWEKAKRNQEAIRFVLKTGETMTIMPSDLHKGVLNKEVFTSKMTPGLKYKLVDFDWKADPRESQDKLL